MDTTSHATFAAVGDLFITRPVPEGGYDGQDALIAFLRAHDVRFANLEVTVHDREGYPFGFSGGTWAMAHPTLLDDVARFGFNAYNAANNHAMDYSHNGLLCTIKYLKERRLAFAGIGENLADASAPVYIEGKNLRASLVACSATFHEAWAAGEQRPDMIGRPGLNPLRAKTKYHITPENARMLRVLAGEIDINAQYNLDVKEGFALPVAGTLRFGGHEFVEDTKNYKETAPHPEDAARILNAVREAKSQSDYVMVSIHSHEMEGEDKERPARFFRDFAHACIDAGAGAVLGHGPHILRGIERYKDGAIFYSLGNFIFENDTTTHQPADFYQKYGLTGHDLAGKGMTVRSQNGTIGLGVDERVWKSVVASWEVHNGKTGVVRLHPIRLGYEKSRWRKGLPVLAQDDKLLQHIKGLSADLGTRLRVQDHVGIIDPV